MKMTFSTPPALLATCLVVLGCGNVPDGSSVEEVDATRTALTNDEIKANTVAIIKQLSQQATPGVTADSTTHTLRSNGGTLGISEYGGGYINRLIFPGTTTDVVGSTSATFGRGGQSALRDHLHSRVYNPTQAGFNEQCGTHVKIDSNPSSNPTQLVLRERRVALWKGDGKYDFTANETTCADPYDDDGRNTDDDNYPNDDYDASGNPTVAQSSEVTSNFDFGGSYKTCESIDSRVTIPCFRHYFMYSYRRFPGTHMAQFLSGTLSGPESGPVLDTSLLDLQIEPGVTTRESDLAHAKVAFMLRFDAALWDAPYTFTYDPETDALSPASAGAVRRYVGENHGPLVIVASSDETDAGRALGVYRPENHINRQSNLRIDASGNVLERFNRDMYDGDTRLIEMTTNPGSANGKMQVVGFSSENRGILHPQRTQWQAAGIYEAYHGEYFILMGTPQAIVDAARILYPL
jgi:hypothetical protein